MFATLQLLFTPGLGRAALVADLVLTVVALAVVGFVVRARRSSPPSVAAEPVGDVVAEAESVTAGAEHQPA